MTHLSLGKKGREVQLAHIARTVRDRPRGVLMGDFNTSDERELAPVLSGARRPRSRR